ncbi:MAG: phosphotransferase family protein [Polyangiaceae bacterium]|nr:phosphotransferase family protein [Polyangiaceae bacterium]
MATLERWLDRAEPIRAGEELDLEPLARHLRERLPEIDAQAELSVEQFPSGHSNLTYLVRAGDRQYVLRRPPFGSKVKTAHDMGREFRVLSKLHAVYPLAPEPLLHCADEGVLGAPFYVMRRTHGLIVRKDLPRGFELGAGQVSALHTQLADRLAELHAIDFAAAGLGDLGKPEGYVERQVRGWAQRYAGSKTDDIPAVEQLAAWLAERLPADGAPGLIHNDFKLDNVVLDPRDPTRIIGVLDWEMCTLGDPLMDLGTTLAYWVEPDDAEQFHAVRWGPTTLPGSLTRRQIADRWAQRTGRDASNALFYYAFGLFKTAVVLQQIYYRYRQGLTHDDRFAMLIHGVRLLAERGVEAIALGRI